MNSFWKRLWTEINLDNLIYNFRSIKALLSPNTKLCCVVKANAYGHHAPRIAKTLEEAGADFFAVSNIEEAVQLREAGVSLPVLILGYTPVECADVLADMDISQCVYSEEYASQLSKYAQLANKPLKIHIKLDTGMGRIGFRCDSANSPIPQIIAACKLPGLIPEGIFTHFALSDAGISGDEFTELQYRKFEKTVHELENIGIEFKYKHCSNSAATVDHSAYELNMVRVGIILYGLLPSDSIVNKISVKPVMTLKTVVSYVKQIDKDDTVSYGCDFVADKKMKIATIPMGYADGFWRSNTQSDLPMKIRGKQAHIVGRICMDQLMLDVTDIEDVCMGDEVTVFGGDAHSVDDFAGSNGTINYEIICSVGRRVPRVFIKDGSVDGIHLGVLDTTVD